MQSVRIRKYAWRFAIACFSLAFAGCMTMFAPSHLAYAEDNEGDGTFIPPQNPTPPTLEPVFDDEPSQDPSGDATDEGSDDGNTSGGSSGDVSTDDSSGDVSTDDSSGDVSTDDSSGGAVSSDSSASGISGESAGGASAESPGTGYAGYSSSTSGDGFVSESSSAIDDEAGESKESAIKGEVKSNAKKPASNSKTTEDEPRKGESKRDFPFVLIGIGVGVLAALGGLYGFVIRPSMISAASAGACTVEAIAEEASRLSLLFRHDPKKILIFHDGNEFAHELCLLIQARLFVVGKEMSYRSFDASEEDLAQFKPDLVVFLLNPGESAESLFPHFGKVKEWYKGAQSGILVAGPFDPAREEELEPLKKSGKIMHYAYEGRNINCALVRFVVPVFKGTIGTNNPMTCIGAVGSVLGIPFVPEACGYYSNGRNMRDVIKAGNIHMDDKICILGDIAGILGIESVSAVVNFVNTAVHEKEDFEEQLSSSEMKWEE